MAKRFFVIHTYIHTYIHTDIHTYTHTYIYIHTYIMYSIYINVYTLIYTYIHTYIYIHVYTYIHIHAHTRVCMHVYTYMVLYQYQWYQNTISISVVLKYHINRTTSAVKRDYCILVNVIRFQSQRDFGNFSACFQGRLILDNEWANRRHLSN